jgi:hypothetical protein
MRTLYFAVALLLAVAAGAVLANTHDELTSAGPGRLLRSPWTKRDASPPHLDEIAAVRLRIIDSPFTVVATSAGQLVSPNDAVAPTTGRF